jgi:hypothetical protein
MKKLSLLTAALCVSLISFGQQDQGKKTPEEKAKHRSEVMKKELTLTQGEYDKVHAEMLRHHKEMEQLKNKEGLKEAKKPEVEKEKTLHQTNMKSILSPEKYEKFQQLKEEKNKEKDQSRQMREEQKKAKK